MDRQSMQLSSGGGSGAATQEWLYLGAGAGGGQPAQVVDGTFLMELLEDASTTEEQEQQQEDVDQLSRVIQSLEAEIDGRPPASAPANGGSSAEYVSDDFDGGLLDDMLSDLGSAPGPCVAEALPTFEYWAEVPPPAVGHEIGGWYLDDDGVVVGGYEFREQCYNNGYGESLPVDQVYSVLWE